MIGKGGANFVCDSPRTRSVMSIFEGNRGSRSERPFRRRRRHQAAICLGEGGRGNGGNARQARRNGLVTRRMAVDFGTDYYAQIKLERRN